MVARGHAMTCWCYILQCENGNHYTGITQNLEARVKLHKAGRGALYTKMNGVADILYAILLPNRSMARQLEIQLKKMGRVKRDSFIESLTEYQEEFGKCGQKKLLHSFLPAGSYFCGHKAAILDAKIYFENLILNDSDKKFRVEIIK